MTSEERIAVGRSFHAALSARNWQALRALLTDDATWTLPGDNLISGKVFGADDVVGRARRIAGFGLTFTLERVLVSRDNIVLFFHNTASREGRVLDEHLATVCLLRDGKISTIETYLSDIGGVNAFFI
jgi:uncharacterized protein